MTLNSLSHLLQGPWPPVVQAEPEPQHLLLPFRQCIQHLHQLFLEQGKGGRILPAQVHLIVLDEIAQMAVLLLTDGRFQGNRLLGDLHDLPHPLHRQLHLLCNLLRSTAPVPGSCRSCSGDPYQLVDGLHHMDRDPDGPGLVRDGPGDGLADPPGGIGTELIALPVIKFFHCLDQSQIPLLDQIQELHAAAHIPFGDADHQTEVGLCQTLLGVLVAQLHAFCQLDLLLSRSAAAPCRSLSGTYAPDPRC